MAHQALAVFAEHWAGEAAAVAAHAEGVGCAEAILQQALLALQLQQHALQPPLIVRAVLTKRWHLIGGCGAGIDCPLAAQTLDGPCIQ